MSAWIVAREHIDLMVSLALTGPRGRDVSPDSAWHGVTWWAENPRGKGWEELAGIRREVRYDNASDVGQMLVCENVQSVRDRYPDVDHGGSAPGPVDEYWREPYEWTRPGYRPTAVEGLSIVACYRYQSCEHDGWDEAEAESFCLALEHTLIRALLGMDDAPWGWDAAEIAKAHQRQSAGEGVVATTD
jgi:hypothetical protein